MSKGEAEGMLELLEIPTEDEGYSEIEIVKQK